MNDYIAINMLTCLFFKTHLGNLRHEKFFPIFVENKCSCSQFSCPFRSLTLTLRQLMTFFGLNAASFYYQPAMNRPQDIKVNVVLLELIELLELLPLLEMLELLDC